MQLKSFDESVRVAQRFTAKKKAARKIFRKIHKKPPAPSHFFSKVKGSSNVRLFKKDSDTDAFL